MSERCTCKWVGEVVETNSTCPIHSIVCTKPLPDPFDERDPVNRCTCPDCAQPERQGARWDEENASSPARCIHGYEYSDLVSEATLCTPECHAAAIRRSPPPTDDIDWQPQRCRCGGVIRQQLMGMSICGSCGRTP